MRCVLGCSDRLSCCFSGCVVFSGVVMKKKEYAKVERLKKKYLSNGVSLSCLRCLSLPSRVFKNEPYILVCVQQEPKH